MTQLLVRRLIIDLETPFDRNWFGGDAFRSALFNALSMSFPVGEQFFIDSVRDGHKALPVEMQARFAGEIQGFIGQEATHRRIHGLFNQQLTLQGLDNAWERRARQRLEILRGADPRHALAATAANEHFTAIFADWMLANHDLLDGSEPRLKTLWLWHASEESEHKCTAFDLYRALGGNEEWRIRWFWRVTTIFLADTARQTLLNLRQSGQLWKWQTWKSAAGFLFGQRGLVRRSYRPWREYLRADFHPSQLDSPLSRHWLESNAAAYVAVGTPR